MADDALAAAVRAALAWLYDTEQPGDAWLQHHGVGIRPPDADRTVSAVPAGMGGVAWGRPVLALEVVNPRYRADDSPGHWDVLNGFRAGELDAFADLVEQQGRRVVDRWNGQPLARSGSLALADRAHPSLLAAVGRYHAGCPDHATPLCSWDGCDWYRRGWARVVRPSIVGAAP